MARVYYDIYYYHFYRYYFHWLSFFNYAVNMTILSSLFLSWLLRSCFAVFLGGSIGLAAGVCVAGDTREWNCMCACVLRMRLWTFYSYACGCVSVTINECAHVWVYVREFGVLFVIAFDFVLTRNFYLTETRMGIYTLERRLDVSLSCAHWRALSIIWRHWEGVCMCVYASVYVSVLAFVGTCEKRRNITRNF